MLHLDLTKDRQALRTEFAKDRRINIPDIWHLASAELIAETLSGETPYKSAFTAGPKVQSLWDDEMRLLPPEQQRLIQKQIYQNAANGIGFIYGTHMLGSPQRLPTPAVLQQAHQLVNSEAVLDFVRDISGFDNIVCASMQATRYLPGNFLTRHNDVVGEEGRLLAYVFGFTPQWHPDWGGLLQFFTAAGEPTSAIVPQMNNLVIFDVHHPHAVSFVTPFAKAHRFSLTGWFRSKPQTAGGLG